MVNLVGPRRFQSFFGLFLILVCLDAFTAATGSAAPRKKAALTPDTCVTALARGDDSSTPQGVLKHGEHWVDLILAQAGQESPRAGRAFEEIAQSLLGQIQRGVVPFVNEKIDGSPSVVIGFTAQGVPYVTYKGDLSATKQRLVTSPEDAAKMFRGALQSVYAQAIAEIGPGLARWRQNARVAGVDPAELVFQGDLLFSEPQVEAESGQTEGEEKKPRVVRTPEAVRIQANSLSYTVGATHPLFVELSRARVGIALHTVGRRVLGPDGRVANVAWNAPADVRRAAVESLVHALRGPTLFAIDTWRKDVVLARSFSAAQVELARELMVGVSARLAMLTPQFKRAWSAKHEARFRIFFNSFLKPGSNGGFFRDAREGKALDYDRLMRRLNGWLAERVKRETEDESDEAALRELRTGPHAAELRALIEAYFMASQLQYLLMPALGEVFESKLGGGEVEGVMLETSDTIVKLVDRLGFTLRNNAHWNRGNRGGSAPDTSATGLETSLPAPFDGISGGEAFVLMKGQPVHSGHIEMIRQAVKQNAGAPVHVILSSKEPDLTAQDWRDLGVADTKKALERRNYTYVFDVGLKREILEAGLKSEITRGRVRIHTLNPGLLWVASARWLHERETGVALKRPVSLVVGEKEMDQARYDDQLEQYAGVLTPLVIPMQSGGVSGTQVRRALRDAVSGDAALEKAAMQVIAESLAAVPNARTRARLVKRVIARYREVDARVTELLKQ